MSRSNLCVGDRAGRIRGDVWWPSIWLPSCPKGRCITSAKYRACGRKYPAAAQSAKRNLDIFSAGHRCTTDIFYNLQRTPV